jgi:hypothetical protein
VLEQVACLPSGDRWSWSSDWKVDGFGVRVEVYRLAHRLRGGERLLFEAYCADEEEAAREADRYERRGYVARVVLRGD